jgi:AcrR family transcriptional regulator
MAKDDTTRRFLQAGRSILATGTELGVNAVAKRAGLNKVLIYRYFGDWNGYLDQLAAGLNLWKDIRVELADGLNSARWPDPAAAAAWVLGTYQHRLRANTMVCTIMATEQARSSPLLRHLDAERETEGLLIMQAFNEKWPVLPRERSIVLSTILSAGLSHLVLRSRQAPVFNGLDLAKDETWEKLIDEIEAVLRKLLE